MTYDEALLRAVEQSIHLRLARTLPNMSDSERIALYKSGFGDGLQFGLAEALRLWNTSADEGRRELEQPAWLRNALTGGRDPGAVN